MLSQTRKFPIFSFASMTICTSVLLIKIWFCQIPQSLPPLLSSLLSSFSSAVCLFIHIAFFLGKFIVVILFSVVQWNCSSTWMYNGIVVSIWSLQCMCNAVNARNSWQYALSYPRVSSLDAKFSSH